MSKFIRVEDLNLWFDVNDLPNFKKLSWANELPQIDPAEIAKRLKEENNGGNSLRYYNLAINDFLAALEK